jgi:hypothetical protein
MLTLPFDPNFVRVSRHEWDLTNGVGEVLGHMEYMDDGPWAGMWTSYLPGTTSLDDSGLITITETRSEAEFALLAHYAK